MNKNMKKVIKYHLKMTLFCSALLLLSGIGIITTNIHTQWFATTQTLAQGTSPNNSVNNSAQGVAFSTSCTTPTAAPPLPTSTPPPITPSPSSTTPTPIQTSTPVAITPSSTVTSTSSLSSISVHTFSFLNMSMQSSQCTNPTPTVNSIPTQTTQATPTITNSGAVPPVNGTVPATTATATPKARATSTSEAATPVTVPTASSTTDTTNTDTNNQQGSGLNTFLLPAGIGFVVLLVVGSLIGFAFMRKRLQEKQASFAASSTLASNHTSSWISEPPIADAAILANERLNVQPAPVLPPASSEVLFSSLTMANPTYLPSTPMPFSSPSIMPQSATLNPEAVPNFVYRPTDLRPLTTPLPRQLPLNRQRDEGNITKNNPISPMSLDGLNFATILEEVEKNQTETWQGLNSQSGPIAVLPPSIQDDPVLETIMRQAQMGLYALPDRPQQDNKDQEDQEEVLIN